MAKLSMVEAGQKAESTVDFAKFVDEFKKHGVKMLLAGIVAAALAWPLLNMLASKYVSTATVLIKTQQDNVSPLPQVVEYDTTRSGYYETQYALMQSRVVLERAIRDLKLVQHPAFNEANQQGKTADAESPQRFDAVLKTLQQNLTVAGVRATQLVTVSFESASPQLSAEVANGVAQAFIDYTAEQKRLKTLKAKALNSGQLALVGQQIAEQKEAIQRFMKENDLLTFRGIDGFDTELLSIVTSQLAEATRQRIQAETHYNAIRSGSGKTLQEVISVPAISGHAQIQDLRIALIQAKRSLYDLRKRYGPRHLKVMEAQAQVAAVEDQTRSVLVELEAGLQKDYQSALAAENYYQQQADRQKAAFQSRAFAREEYNQLQAELDKSEELYKTLYQRTREQSLSASYTEPDVILYDPAVPPDRASGPKKQLLTIMAVLLVLIAYAIYIIVKTAMDSSVNSLSKVKKRLRAEPLGEIRHFTEAGSRAQLAKRILDDPLDSDAIHRIRSRILLARPELECIAIGSAEQAEGRSFLAELLANSFSFDQKTLLIDADFFNQSGLTQDLSPPNACGLAELLNGSAVLDNTILSLNENLAFLPRGNARISSLLMLSSESFFQLIAELKRRYQRIIIDVAAINQTEDLALVNRASDGFIFILKAGAVPAHEVLKALEKARQREALFIGAVLNQVADKNLESKEGLRALNQQTHALISEPDQR